MMIQYATCYPRVGLVGNPSDGYFGKTLSFTFANFRAKVALYESPELQILPNDKDHSVFKSMEHLARDVHFHGYYGGIRLLKATLKRFYDYCQAQKIKLSKRNFTIRYESNIPHGVGLAGSSAIITACQRALMRFYDVSIPLWRQAHLVWAAEAEELHIPAGLQDRVVQVYDGLIYMDFDKELMDRQGHGHYERLDSHLLPALYIAYLSNLGEPTEVVHSRLKQRYHQGNRQVHAAMRFWANLTDKARAALEAGAMDRLPDLLDANFDRRQKICRLNPLQLNMVETARSVGASAKYTGSGGAIVGTFKNQAMFNKLQDRMKQIGAKIIRPRIVNPRTTS